MMSTDVQHQPTGEADAVDETDDATAESSPPPDAPQPEASERGGRGGRGSLVLLVVAALVAISGGVAWWLADADEDRARAEQRDVVMVEGRTAIETMNTLDYRDVDGGLAAWQSVTTGTLADQLASVGDDERQLLAEQAKISTGTVLDAAVLELDDETATLLASVEVAVVDEAEGADEDAGPSVKRNRFSAELLLVDGEWKLQALQQVPVNL